MLGKTNGTKPVKATPMTSFCCPTISDTDGMTPHVTCAVWVSVYTDWSLAQADRPASVPLAWLWLWW